MVSGIWLVEQALEAVGSGPGRRSGENTSWKCPAHDDNNPSLSVRDANGRVLLNCFGGCDSSTILEALGLSWREVYGADSDELEPEDFVEVLEQAKARGRQKSRASAKQAKEEGDNKPPLKREGKQHLKPVEQYVYGDEQRKPLYRVVRYEPKTFRQFRREDNAWRPGMGGVRRVLYRLPEVLRAIERGEEIWVAEGEKAVHALVELGVEATCSPGGASKWKEEYSKSLKGADVIITPDNDLPGRKHAAQVMAALRGFAKSVRTVMLPDLPDRGDAYDWIRAGGTLEQLKRLAAAVDAVELKARSKSFTISEDIKAAVDALESALLEAEANIFQRGGELVQIVEESEASVRGRIHRENRRAWIRRAPASALWELGSELIEWRKADARYKRGYKIVAQPQWVGNRLLERGSWGFPRLDGVLMAPTLREDGSLCQEPGYDAASGFYFHLPSSFPCVPERPSAVDINAANALLTDALANFAFADESSCSAAKAAILTSVARPGIPGNVPVFGVSAPTPRTGKTLLCDTISVGATGTRLPRISPAKDPDEDRKTLVALAMAGDLLVLYDNIPPGQAFGTGPLAAALTASAIRGRILGKSEMVSVPWRAIVFVTGNGLAFTGDLRERVVPMLLDAHLERPDERTDFRAPDRAGEDAQLDWMQRQHPQIVAAALTILRGYLASGAQPDMTPWGGFGAWNRLIRGALLWLGEPDPAANRRNFSAMADPVSDAHSELLQAWHSVFDDAGKTLAEVRQHLSIYAGRLPRELEDAERFESAERLLDALQQVAPPRGKDTFNARSLGRFLGGRCGRIQNGMAFERSKTAPGRPWSWAAKKVVS